MDLSDILKAGVNFRERNGIYFELDAKGKPITFKPWLGDLFAFFYDTIMKRMIFPKKFNGSIDRHFDILKGLLGDVHDKQVLELATGSGSVVNILPVDNNYAGTDISPGLLKCAVKNLRTSGFESPGFFINDARELPFRDDCFELILCILALNFFPDLDSLIRELTRVAKPGSTLVSCVPVPERNPGNNPVRGTLFSENELKQKFNDSGWEFRSVPESNGILLYFQAILS